MPPLTLLVLANPGDRSLAALERLPGDTRIAAGDRPEAFAEAAREADAVLFWSAPPHLLETVLKAAPEVRWVHTASAGVDALLSAELVERPIVLTNGRGVYSAALAEFALAAILFFARDLRRLLAAQAARRWEPFDAGRVEGRTLGIVGYGDIGRAVAVRARSLGMRVLALRRAAPLYSADPLVERTFPSDARREMLAMCDYVLISAALTAATHGLIGAAELAAMNAGAVLVNVSRGAVVDEAALVRALRDGRLRGAALDVFAEEPLPPGHEFYRLDNVLLSPHCADHTRDRFDRSMELFLANFERFRAGLPLENVVDKRRGY